MATEIAILALPAGSTIEDPSTPSGAIFQDTLKTVSAQEGFQRASWGRWVEDASMLQLMVDWDAVSSHEKFMKDPIYNPFVKHLLSILDPASPAQIFHAHFTPHPPSPLSGTANPVTELVTLYYPTTFSDADKQNVDDNQKKFVEVLGRHEGFKGGAGGWVVEEREYDGKEGGKEKGKAVVFALGWESVEAHMKFRETDDFKENIGGLREGSVGSEMHHVKFRDS